MTVLMFGLGSTDTFHLNQYGGSFDAQLLELKAGRFVVDTAARIPGIEENITLRFPARVNGEIVMTNRGGDVFFTATDYPSFRLTGSQTQDHLLLLASAPISGIQHIRLDASAARGEVELRLLGDASHRHDVTVSHLNALATLALWGQATTSQLHVGTGLLSRIENDIFASRFEVSVDNRLSVLEDRLFLDTNQFGSWKLPDSSVIRPKFRYEYLRGIFEVFVGAGDDFQLHATAASINELIMHASSPDHNSKVYTSSFSVPITLFGNFSFYAGQELLPDGSVERIRQLTDLDIPVYLYRSGNSESELVIDGALDPQDVEYDINLIKYENTRADREDSGWRIQHITYGMLVHVFGYRTADSVRMHLGGAHVTGNMRSGLRGTFYLDGRDRLGGLKPNAVNQYDLLLPSGVNHLDPLSEFDSVLSSSYNSIQVLGSMPQDALDVLIPTDARVAPNRVQWGPSSWAVSHPTLGPFAAAAILNPPAIPLYQPSFTSCLPLVLQSVFHCWKQGQILHQVPSHK